MPFDESVIQWNLYHLNFDGNVTPWYRMVEKKTRFLDFVRYNLDFKDEVIESEDAETSDEEDAEDQVEEDVVIFRLHE